MSKNALPEKQSCDKLQLWQSILAEVNEIDRIYTDINRVNGRIEKEILEVIERNRVSEVNLHRDREEVKTRTAAMKKHHNRLGDLLTEFFTTI